MIRKNALTLSLVGMFVAICVFDAGSVGSAYAEDTRSDHTHHDHQHGHSHGHKVDLSALSVEDVMKAIRDNERNLNAVIADKKHDHTFAAAIEEYARALPAKVSADKRSRVEGSANNISKLTRALHDSQHAGNNMETEANLKKLSAVIGLLEAQVK